MTGTAVKHFTSPGRMLKMVGNDAAGPDRSKICSVSQRSSKEVR